MWFALAVIGYILLAVVSITDKLILTKTVQKPALFTFYSSVFILPLLLLVPFGVTFLGSLNHWAIAAASGFAFAFALWCMYIAIQSSEISHIQPLIGAATPIFVFFVGSIFLAERLTPLQLVAGAVIVIGSLVISAEKSETHNGFHRGIAWAVLSAFLFALSHVYAKYIYQIYDFYSGFIWTRLFIGVFGLFLLLSPDVRKSLFKKKEKTDPTKQAAGKCWLLV